MSNIIANGMQNYDLAPPLAFAERDLASALLASDILVRTCNTLHFNCFPFFNCFP